MRRNRIVISFAIAIVLSLTYGCATFMEYGKLEKNARGNYGRGSYDIAVSDCVAALKLNPDYGKAQALIKDAFRMAVDAHESRIRELDHSSGKFRWDEVVAEYEALIKLHQTVKSLPTLTDKETGEAMKFEMADYTQDLAAAKDKRRRSSLSGRDSSVPER